MRSTSGCIRQQERTTVIVARLAKDVEGASVVPRPQRRRDAVHQYGVRRRAGVRDHLPIIGHARVAPVAAQVRREARRDGRRRAPTTGLGAASGRVTTRRGSSGAEVVVQDPRIII